MSDKIKIVFELLHAIDGGLGLFEENEDGGRDPAGVAEGPGRRRRRRTFRPRINLDMPSLDYFR